MNNAVKYIPDWFPGAGFKQYAKKGHALAMDVLHLPYAMGKERAVSYLFLSTIELHVTNLEKTAFDIS